MCLFSGFAKIGYQSLHCRASSILRSQAETTLRHLTLTAFGRADQALKKHDARQSYYFSEDHDLGFTELLRGATWEKASQQHTISETLGITLLIGKIMSILSELMALQDQKPETVKSALSLINIALEAGGPSLGGMAPVVSILSGDVCRHLLRSTQSDDLEIFSLALRVVFNLFMSIKDHMKVQLEVFLSSVHLRLLQSKTINDPEASSDAKEELALESLLEFCREPALMHDIYTNYDCDIHCSNLFDCIISTLCAKASPACVTPLTAPHAAGTSSASSSSSKESKDVIGAGPLPVSTRLKKSLHAAAAVRCHPGTQITAMNRLALDGTLAVLRSVAIRCNSGTFMAANKQQSSLIGERVSRISDGSSDGILSRSPLYSTENILAQQVGRWADDCVLPLPATTTVPSRSPPRAARVPGEENPEASASLSCGSYDAADGWDGEDLWDADDLDGAVVMQTRRRTIEVYIC